MANPSVIGRIQFHKNRIETDRKPIAINSEGKEGEELVHVYITDEYVIKPSDFAQVQKLLELKGGTRTTKKNYSILDGLIFCGYSNLNPSLKDVKCYMYKHKRVGSNTQSYAYKEKRDKAYNQHWHKELLEEAFIDSLNYFDIDFEDDKDNEQINNLKSSLEVLRIDIDNINERKRIKSIDKEDINLSKKIRYKLYEDIEELDNELEVLLKQQQELHNNLELKSNASNTEYRKLIDKDEWRKNIDNPEYITKVNNDIVQKIKGVYIFAHGFEYRQNIINSCIRWVNKFITDILYLDGIEYTDQVKAKLYKNIDRHFEKNPFLFFIHLKSMMNRAVVGRKPKSEAKIKSQLEKAYNIYVKMVKSFNNPSTSKKHRFFFIRTIDDKLIWVKPKEKNLGKNNLRPSYIDVDWATRGNRMMSSSKDALYYCYDGPLTIITTIPTTLDAGDTYEINGTNEITQVTSNKKPLTIKDIIEKNKSKRT